MFKRGLISDGLRMYGFFYYLPGFGIFALDEIDQVIY